MSGQSIVTEQLASSRVARRAFLGIHALRLLGTDEAGSQFPHSDHDWCRFLFGLR